MTSPDRLRTSVLAVAVGAAALATVLVAGCDDDSPGAGGGDPIDASGAPAAAPVQAFCAAWDRARGLDASRGDDDLAGALHDLTAELARVGTPDDIPRAGRSGFVVYVAAVSVADGDQARSLVGDPSADTYASALGLDDDQRPDLAAFLDYLAGTCFG